MLKTQGIAVMKLLCGLAEYVQFQWLKWRKQHQGLRSLNFSVKNSPPDNAVLPDFN